MPQLSLPQRQAIERLTQQKVSQSAIARELGVHRSTIKRELDRNSQQGVYSALDAHSLCLYRKTMAGELSQLGKRPAPGHFEPKVKAQKRKTIGRKPKKRIRRRRLRIRDYIPYVYRPDHRPYSAHANKKRRSIFYYFWKKAYEPIYRIRCHRQEEENRTPRDKYTFQAYAHWNWPEYIRKHRLWQQKLNRFRRKNWEMRWRRIQFRAMNVRLKIMGWMIEDMKKEQKQPLTQNTPLKSHNIRKTLVLFLSRPRHTGRTAEPSPPIVFSPEPGRLAHAPP